MGWLDVPQREIACSAALLRHFRAFRASGCRAMRDPADPFGVDTLTQDDARKRLWTMLDDAINRKAGLHLARGRKDCVDHQRRLREIGRRVRHAQFETAECRLRFSDRLSRFDD